MVHAFIAIIQLCMYKSTYIHEHKNALDVQGLSGMHFDVQSYCMLILSCDHFLYLIGYGQLKLLQRIQPYSLYVAQKLLYSKYVQLHKLYAHLSGCV